MEFERDMKEYEQLGIDPTKFETRLRKSNKFMKYNMDEHEKME